MHRHAAAARDEPDDFIARDRLAAFPVTNQSVVLPLDADARPVLVAAYAMHQTPEAGLLLLFPLAHEFLGQQLMGDLTRGYAPEANRRQQILIALNPEEARHLLQRAGLHVWPGMPHAMAQLVLQQLLAEREGALPLLLPDPVSDFLLRPGGDDELHPIDAGLSVLIRDYLDDVAVFEEGAQRRDFPVDLRPDAVAAHLRVDREGEIDRRRSARQALHLAPRGENEHLVLEQVDLHGIDQISRIGFFVQALHDSSEPLELVGEAVVALLLALLVFPVRGDPSLRHPVHLFRANLEFHPLSLRSQDSGVQGLIQIRLGQGDVVLEASGDGRPAGVQNPQHRVAILHVVHDDSHATNVIDLVEVEILRLHLLVDAGMKLESGGRRPADAGFFEAFVQLRDDLVHIRFAVFQAVAEQLVDLQELLGAQMLERRVLKRSLEPADADAVGERRVYFRRFPGDALSSFLREMLKRQRVVEPVREFDDDDADVLRHGDQHLAVAFRLPDLGVRAVDLRQLRDAVHELGDVLPEVLVNLLERRRGILHGIVQQAGAYRFGVLAQLRQNARHFQRMGDVGLPGNPGLPLVDFRRKNIGLGEQRRAVGRILLDQIDDVHDPGGRTRRQNRRQRIPSSFDRFRRRFIPGKRGGLASPSGHNAKRYPSPRTASRSPLTKNSPDARRGRLNGPASVCSISAEGRGYKFVHERRHVFGFVLMFRHDDRSLVANLLAKPAADAGGLIHDGHRAVIPLHGRGRHANAIERADVHAPDAAGAVLLQDKRLGHVLVLDVANHLPGVVLNGERRAILAAHAAVNAERGVDFVDFARLARDGLRRTNGLAHRTPDASVEYEVGHRSAS